jgi:hypothetical protein
VAGLSLQALADEQRRAELERQQIALGLASHVDGCVQAQKRVEKRFDDMDDRFDKIDACLKVVSDAQVASAAAAIAVADLRAKMSAPKWWMPWAGRLAWAALTGAGALIIFLGTAVIKDHDQIQSLQSRPATQVTVQPAAPIQPIAQPTAPAPSTPPSALSDDPPAQ